MRIFVARALGIALALVLFEVVVRQVYSLSSVWEPDYGIVNAPGRPVRWSREGHATSHWSAHGLRAHEALDTKARPILVLGDSFTEGVQVDDDEVYPFLVERALRERGHDLPVWNAGRSSASVADYVAFAPRHRRLFSPRWTVIQLRDDDLEDDAWDEAKTHLEAAEGGLVATPVVPPLRAGLSGRLWTLRQDVMLVGYGVVRFGELRRASAEEPPLFRAGSAPRPEPPPARDYPVEAEIDLLFGAYDGRATVLYLSTFDPKLPGARTPTEARVLEHCARTGWSCVSIRSQLGALWARGRSPYGHTNSGWNTGHMNAEGHRAAATALAAELGRLANDGLL